MKKINIKKPKYIIPLITLPVLLFIGWQVSSMLSFDKDKDKVVITDDVNTDLPEANLKKLSIKSKYKSMKENFENEKQYSAVNVVEKEEEEKLKMESVYSEAEKARMDSLDRLRKEEEQRLKQLVTQTNHLETQPKEDEKKTKNSQELSDIEKQLQLIQKMAEGEKILSPEEKEAQKKEQLAAILRQELADSIARSKGPQEVFKTGEAHEESFNTVGDRSRKNNLIRGRVDELVKATDGSRLRIRLSDDVEINGSIIPKGTYLYANVEGFSAQRVKASVTSIMVDGIITPVKLSVYDMDCQEGFFVPTSAFRDLAKNAGSKAMSGVNVNMNSNTGEQSLQSVAMQGLQQALSATTSAVGASIRQNRAKIKYNTEVYLISKTNEK